MNIQTALRAIACWIWMTCGLIQGGIIGYFSAIASIMFLLALAVEEADK